MLLLADLDLVSFTDGWHEHDDKSSEHRNAVTNPDKKVMNALIVSRNLLICIKSKFSTEN